MATLSTTPNPCPFLQIRAHTFLHQAFASYFSHKQHPVLSTLVLGVQKIAGCCLHSPSCCSCCLLEHVFTQTPESVTHVHLQQHQTQHVCCTVELSTTSLAEVLLDRSTCSQLLQCTVVSAASGSQPCRTLPANCLRCQQQGILCKSSQHTQHDSNASKVPFRKTNSWCTAPTCVCGEQVQSKLCRRAA